MYFLQKSNPIRSIKEFIECLRDGSWRQPWFQLFFCLVLMSTHWIYLETWSGISPVKVTYMCLCSIFLFKLGKKIQKSVFYLTGIFFLFVLLSAYVFSDGVFSYKSIGYMLMFLVTYCYYISLLYSNAASYEQCLVFLRGMIMAYFFFICLQQITAFLHLPIPILNCHGYSWGWKFPGMNTEPSHCSRVLATIFLVFIEMLHLRHPQARSFNYIWLHERIYLCVFIYSLCTMGSGMGVAALTLIMLYILFFTKYTWFIFTSIICCILLFLIRNTEAFTRFLNSFQATMTLNEEIIHESDGSAAARINVILGTFQNADFTDWNFWVGNGRESDHTMSGILNIYGAIPFLAQMILLLKFAWRRLFSIEVLMFIIFNSLALGNVAYVWAMIMYWSMLKYFTLRERHRMFYASIKTMPHVL